MHDRALTLALIRDVFFQPDGPGRLLERLHEARTQGAELAVLPELALNPWSPATRNARDEDAEPAGGDRHRILSQSARQAGIAVLGGTIVTDPETAQRYNTALLFDSSGHLAGSYRKIHIPEEEGFWETSHYEAGEQPPSVIDDFGLPVGVQICSDVNRPVMSHLLAALGAQVIVAPRASCESTYPRWRVVLEANAMTTATYYASVPRPLPEQGVPLGGPSVIVGPRGEVLVESDEPITVLRLKHSEIIKARREYPGYLAVRTRLYAEAWARAASRST